MWWNKQHLRAYFEALITYWLLLIEINEINDFYNKRCFFVGQTFLLKYINDAHREKAPSNKISALTKSMNMDIWVAGTSDQLFIRDLNLSESKFFIK